MTDKELDTLMKLAGFTDKSKLEMWKHSWDGSKGQIASLLLEIDRLKRENAELRFANKALAEAGAAMLRVDLVRSNPEYIAPFVPCQHQWVNNHCSICGMDK